MQHIMRHLIKATRHPSASAQCPFRSLAHSDLSADAGEVLLHLPIAAVEASSDYSRKVPSASTFPNRS